MCRKLQIILLFLIGIIETASAQSALKIGENEYTISDNAILDIESTSKGFLLPRMTVVQRDAMASPPEGLQVWCTDCNRATNPPSAELCVYFDYGWAPIALIRDAKVSTAKKSDVNASVMVSSTSATINGTLVSTSGLPPTETGVVWKEITGNDFGTLPSLDGNALATPPVYKTVGTLVNTVGGAISVSIASLTSTTSDTRPYYFRTYAKNSLGVGYGNAIILNGAPPVLSLPIVTNGSGFTPAFAGTLTVNAGTLQGTVTEYGYCSSTTNTSPTSADNSVVLSTTTSLATLNTALNSETFTTDPTVDLQVNNYVPTTSGVAIYFRYYVIANGITIYSPVATFTPVGDPVTGGSAVATVSVSALSAPLKIGAVSSSTFTATFTVTTPGTYSDFTLDSTTGATTGLSIPTIPAGTFATAGTQTLTFLVTGTPDTSLDGNSFVISRLGTLTTGAVQIGDMLGSNATCDVLHATTVVELPSSKTARIWMDRNLGASRTALSSDDYQAYGCLYQWGRGTDGHASITWSSSTTGAAVQGIVASTVSIDTPASPLFIVDATAPFDWRIPQNGNLWQTVANNNNPCPTSYRLPTKAEVDAELNAATVNSVVYPAMTNLAIAYNQLYIVSAGNRLGNTGALSGVGSIGVYWTSSASGTNKTSAMVFGATGANYTNGNRLVGMTVRCIKN